MIGLLVPEDDFFWGRDLDRWRLLLMVAVIVREGADNGWPY